VCRGLLLCMRGRLWRDVEEQLREDVTVTLTDWEGDAQHKMLR
jgi:hypothetical protein